MLALWAPLAFSPLRAPLALAALRVRRRRLSPHPRPAEGGTVKVLVADDQALWRRCLSDALGEWGYSVTAVEDGAAAWQAVREDPEISILITDWVMPGMTGPELCRRIRGLERPRYLPILLLTSRAGRDDLALALEAGADAFVRKPFHAPELLAQLRVAERILRLEDRLAHQLEDLSGAMRRVEADLANAAAIQRSLLPDRAPEIPGISVAWHHRACERLGGDLFHVLRLDEDHLALYVLDVSGHGTSAALHSVALSRALSPPAEQGGILMRGGAPVPPCEVAEQLGRRFPPLERSGQYLTFLYGILELSSLRFRYVRAGHPGPLRVHRGAARFHDEGGGIPIGVSPEARYRDQELELAPGDTLWLFTDGVHETRDESGEEFGIARLLEAAAAASPLGVERGVEALRARLDDFRKQGPQRDDVTLVGLAVRETPRGRKGGLRLV
jgi:sigma-B regulation protein RsbU (phosphoserine phosphatase)